MNKLTPPGLLFLVCSAVFLHADDDPTVLNNIIAAKTCDQILVSPDKHWLAVTRTYSETDPGYIWKTDDNSSLVIWAFDSHISDDSGSINVPDYVRWDCPRTNKIVKIAWSPDSQFLVIVTSNAAGHEPWLFPTLVFDLKDNTIHKTNLSVVSADFKFVGPHILQLKTGDPSTSQFTTLDISAQSSDLPVLVQLKPLKESE
jgi:hypothetical protein